MLDRSRVTVIVPTYNRSASLRRCLLALLACDTTGLEVTVRVADDGSTDDTEAMVAALQQEYEGAARLCYHRQENQGQSAARNLAISLSDTDLLLFLDDDCVPEAGWVQALVGFGWEERVGAVGGRLVASEQGNWVSRYCRFIRYNEFPMDDGPVRFVNSANCAYQRKALLEVGGYERALTRGVDHDLGWRILLAGYELRYQPAAVVHHYHRESLRILVRDFWRKGYTNALRRAMWEAEPPPTWGLLARELLRVVFLSLHPVLLPFDAVRLAQREVAARDAVPFAFVRWLLRFASRCGKVAMMARILTGRQSIDRTCPRPEGPADLSQAPAWARSGDEGS